jgi:hypothetical protein
VITGPPGSGSNAIPNGCPGSTSPSTAASPTGCSLQYSKDKEIRIYPGVYWGGLLLKETGGSTNLRVYMEPGIYYMAGGGLEVAGGITLRSVHPGGTTFDNSSATMGVMIYNTDDPQYHTACVNGTGAGKQCISTIDFQTSNSSDVDLRGDKIDTAFKNLLFFQDPDASSQPAVSMEGHSTQTMFGTIYLPEAEFAYHGNGAGEALQTQIIVDTFTVTGNGIVDINYDAGAVYQFKGIGLVQ